MNMHSLPPRSARRRRHRESGVAIILVLAFLVLLTGLMVAFFSRAMTERQVANSSLSQSKVEILSRSAVDVILGDLKQEIADGSVSPAPTPAPGVTIYLPKEPANMLPQTSGIPAPVANPSPSPATLPIPNLVRRSVRDDPLARTSVAAPPAPGFKAVTTAASAVNSTGDVSINGRLVTPARWNSHYFIPRLTPGNTTIDSTPVDAFTAPDWVMVTTNGPKVLTTPKKDADGNDVTPIGRYAYAIYDEGGLLDINAAGYPSLTNPNQSASKGSLAYADLSQLTYPIPRTPANGETQVDQIVGWRNFATTQPSGTFGNYRIDVTAAKRYSDFILGINTGFLTVNPKLPSPASPASRTDQMFTSRQALLSFRRSINFSQNALQYLTTFSRALDQPSFVPARIQHPATAPRINALGTTAPPPASSVDSYLGNNDAAGSSGAVDGQDLINPAVLTVRVQNAFTRQDLDKTPAVVGEPLVKRRFALSRLAEIPFNATDATTSVTDPTATKNHIKDWFGLARTSTSAHWTYHHGAGKIMTLKEVAAANREPDFAELLKAAINVGSLAKGGPNLHNNQGNYQYTLDTSVDYQILQIMVNLIDQNDSDSFPTVVQIAAPNGGTMRTFRGTEDLPYFYRYHPMTVVTKLPSPLLSKNADKVAWRKAGEAITVPPFKTTLACAAGTLTDGGEAVYMYAPDVWNPHDASATLKNPAGPRPTRFRLAVVTRDPVGQTPSWNTGAVAKVDGDWYDDIPMKASIPSSLKPLDSEEATAFTFGDDGGKLFREPTLLWRADAPAGSGLQAESGSLAGPHTDANTGVAYFGVQIGKTPVSYIGSVDATKYYGTPASPNGSYIFQASALEPAQQVPSGAYAQYTFRLQYQDPGGSGAWITYDEKYPDFHGLFRPSLIVNKADYSGDRWKNPYSSGQMNDCSTGYDPRTARFGIGTATTLDYSGSPMLEPGASANYNSGNASGNQTFADSRATVLVTQRPAGDRGNRTNYSNPGMTSDPGKNLQMRWFGGVGFSGSNGQNTSPNQYDGLFSQNDPKLNILARDNSTVTQLYYEDADGVARRAMGAYAQKDPATGTLPAAKSSAANQKLEGLPLVTANDYAAGSFGVGTPKSNGQNQSRPLMLNRALRSVAEMSYAFRGTPWKQLDFFTPESGDAFLLDTFCVNEAPAGGLVAGKVNLNTRQMPVLKAILAGAYRDEQASYPTPPTYGALPALTGPEAENVANKLISITTANTAATPWRGPLANVGHLVGRFVPDAGSPGTATDQFTYKTYTYAGLSGALDGTNNLSGDNLPTTGLTNYKVQRMREAAIRPLADAGQTRVWNLMVDVVAQTGRYGPNATALSQFNVEGEKRYWVHLALDRYTGEVIDKQIETVTE